jgi:phage recombination protein Bet
VVPDASAPAVTADQLELVRATVAKDATPDELKLYLYDCARQGVHPLDKLLHFTKRGGRYTPVTSIDLMRMRAADTHEYGGNDPYLFAGSPGKPGFTATATVWRLVNGTRVAFARAARWEEFCPSAGSDHMWRKMPHVMLGKCAEAQALRVGFPRQLHGVYAAEELEAADAPATPRAPAITAAQWKTLVATARQHGWSDDQLTTYFKECGWESRRDIPADQYDALVAALEKGRTVDETETGG